MYFASQNRAYTRMKNKDLLNKYIARLLTLKEQKRDELTETELKEIAQELGLTDSDLLEAEQEVKNHLERGQTYTQLKQWNEAQKEFEQAAEFAPLDIEVTYELAHFYFLKWQKTKKQSDLRFAQTKIVNCLELSPKHVGTITLFEQIEKAKRKQKSFSRIKVFVFLFLFLPIIAGTTFFVLNEIGYFSAPRTGLEGQNYTIENIEFIPNEQSEGLDFTVNHLKIIHPQYPSSDFEYDLVGNIKSSKFEIRRLAVKAEFLGKNNEILAGELFWFFDVADVKNPFDDSFSLQVNDRYPFSFLSERDRNTIYFDKNKAQKIVKVRFVIHHLERYAPAASYPEYKLLEPNWAVVKNDGVNLEIRERKNSTFRPSNDESTINKLVLEVKNTATKPIKELFIRVNWLDKEGKSMYEYEFRPIGIYSEALEVDKILVIEYEKYFWDSSYPNYAEKFKEHQFSISNIN